jgi:hypothetical protein
MDSSLDPPAQPPYHLNPIIMIAAKATNGNGSTALVDKTGASNHPSVPPTALTATSAQTGTIPNKSKFSSKARSSFRDQIKQTKEAMGEQAFKDQLEADALLTAEYERTDSPSITIHRNRVRERRLAYLEEVAVGPGRDITDPFEA